jgi:FAD/FMN-containing dehydrogenase
MSDKIASYLQQHLTGEVVYAKKVREFFSTDGSVFKIMPRLVVYPKNTTDVRKIARFAWQLAERKTPVTLTARGSGTDQSGGAIGPGISVVFPAHMNKVLQLDKNTVTVQPGEIYASLQKTLHTHHRFLPPYPSSIDFATIGGAVANNAAGEKSIKYGQTLDYVESLQVVLANGELIQTGRLGKRALDKKMGETTFEAEIYRQIDALLEENQETVQSTKLDVSKNTAGYNLLDVRGKDGSIDLTPLFVGSQGTLGMITQIKLKTEDYTPDESLVVGFFESIEKADDAVEELKKLKPSALEFVDEHLLRLVHKENPNRLKDLVEEPYPSLVMLAEFDDNKDTVRSRKTKKAVKIISKYAQEYIVAKTPQERDNLWKIRHSAAALMWHSETDAKAVPIIEDGIVPDGKFVEFIEHVYKTYKKYGLETAVWGHAGNNNLHMQPFLDLSKTGDRQKVFAIMDEYYDEIIKMGGSTAGEHNDGRLRAPFLTKLYGEDVYKLFKKVKKIFDPYNVLNEGVKIDVTRDDQKRLLRNEYGMEHLGHHLPRMH